MVMIEKKLTENGRARVTFELPSVIWADRVNLVGDFNDWDTTVTPMLRDRSHDDWRATVELPVGQRYHFRYLLDGHQWLNEWHADGYVDTDNGLCESVVDLVDAGRTPGMPALPEEKGDE
jgi:1,4-alpha-glucan branching enzyme